MWSFSTSRHNTEYFSRAYEWYANTPGFLRSISKMIENEREFEKELSGSLNFFGIIDNKLKAVVHGEHKTDDVLEGHLFCDSDCDIDFISALVTYSKTEVLLHYKTVITSIVTRHKFLYEVMKRSGFYSTGLHAWQGVHRGKLIEIGYYRADRKVIV